jgi:hypothetical protein
VKLDDTVTELTFVPDSVQPLSVFKDESIAALSATKLYEASCATKVPSKIPSVTMPLTAPDTSSDAIGGRFETDAVLFAAFIFTSVFVVFEIGKVLEQEGLVMQKYYESIRLIDMILTTVLSITLINKSDKTKNEVKPP